MGAYIRVAGWFIPVFVKRLFARPSVFAKLAFLSLTFVPIAWLHPLWEQLLEAVLKPYVAFESPLSDFEIGWVFVGICLFFALLAHRASLAVPVEPLRDTKIVTDRIGCGQSSIYLYCGNVSHLDGEVEAIVTSEDTDLELGRLSGNTVSGRVRRMAAELAGTGDVVKDNLREGLDVWKRKQSRQSPFGLGTVVSQDSYRAASYGIKRVFHAVVLEKADGVTSVNESAVRDCLQKVLDECEVRQLRSVFIPLFGTGAGRLSPHDAAMRTVGPLVELLRKKGGFEVYIGTYRLSAMAATWAALSEAA
jgi:O-acetyl-ADP-ribose deacetylase (regulator of RNase III)